MTSEFEHYRQFIKTANAMIPPIAWDCTTPIVIAHNGEVHHFGTGTLFRIADYFFLVTAAHIIKNACNIYNETIGIGGSDGRIVALTESAIISADNQYGDSFDPFDIGIYRLTPDAVSHLNNKLFINLSNIDFDPQPPSTVYALFGFPGEWSSPSTSQDEKVKYKAFQYTTLQYDSDSSKLRGYQERFHLLLNGQLDQGVNEDAVPAHLWLGSYPQDISGISGCGVWRIGDLSIPPEIWDREKPRLIAVQTGIYNEHKALRATRWIAVSTLIHEAFPELRPSMNLWYL